jgi:hypothetical protein
VWRGKAEPVSGWQEFVTTLVANAGWPLVVLILGLTFRKTLRGVLERIANFEGFGARVEFNEGIKRLDEDADVLEFETIERKREPRPVESDQDDEPPDQPQPQPDEDDRAANWQDSWRTERPVGHFVRQHGAIEENESVAIMESWNEIETAIRKLHRDADARGIMISVLPASERTRRLSFREVLSRLASAGILGENDVKLLEEMRATRNRVAHEPAVQPSVGQTMTYLEASRTAERILQGAKAKVVHLSKLQFPRLADSSE